jgi:hyperosmotically inducible protein
MRRTKRLFAIILLIVLALAGYYLYRFGWTTPRFSQLSQVFSSSDPTITSSVKANLASSKLLSGYDMNVKTEDGVVTIGGQVPSDDLKALAEGIARQSAGVKDVKDLIIVGQDTRPGAGNPRIQDLETRTTVLQGLARSPELAGKKIDVSVDNQAVTLTGTVESAQQRMIAEEIARISTGVTSVNNAITVPGAPTVAPAPGATAPAAGQPGGAPASAPESNADLAKHVEFELYSTGAFDVSTMNIKADNGAVTLGGTVRSRAEQLLAERVAQGVSGVKSVSNELKAPAAPARH